MLHKETHGYHYCYEKIEFSGPIRINSTKSNESIRFLFLYNNFIHSLLSYHAIHFHLICLQQPMSYRQKKISVQIEAILLLCKTVEKFSSYATKKSLYFKYHSSTQILFVACPTNIWNAWVEKKYFPKLNLWNVIIERQFQFHRIM